MKRIIVVLSMAIAICAAFAAGYLVNINTDDDHAADQAETAAMDRNPGNSVEGFNPHLEKDLEIAINEETNEKLIWYEKVLLQLTNGEKWDYEKMTSDKGEVIVYLKNAPSDYYERELALITLGVEFAGYDTVSFWYDKEQAQLYMDGKLVKNEDPLLPPYSGMFGEITKNDNVVQLLLHGSTGGPMSLNLGKYSTP